MDTEDRPPEEYTSSRPEPDDRGARLEAALAALQRLADAGALSAGERAAATDRLMGAAPFRAAGPTRSPADVVATGVRNFVAENRGVAAMLVLLALGWGIFQLLPNEQDLKSGQCFRGSVTYYEESVRVIDCAQAGAGDSRVISVFRSSGSTYPGNISTHEQTCFSQGGTPTSPSAETWQSGDRTVLCTEPALGL